MSREIKFRVWDLNERAWVTDWEKQFAPIWTKQNNIFWEARRKSLVLQQFTGFEDAIGKEVFEGDIVKYKSKYHWDVVCESKAIIKFDNGSFYPRPYKEINDEDDFYTYEIYDLKILGNIFENPELLKNEKMD